MSLTAGRQTKCVLVVDDIPDNIFLVQLILETKGYKVNGAPSGFAALSLIKAGSIKPDLIILDLMMPGMNGYEVIKRLQAGKNASHIPILLMTANQEVSPRQAKESGADGILYKPLNLEKFLQKVEQFNL